MYVQRTSHCGTRKTPVSSAAFATTRPRAPPSLCAAPRLESHAAGRAHGPCAAASRRSGTSARRGACALFTETGPASSRPALFFESQRRVRWRALRPASCAGCSAAARTTPPQRAPARTRSNDGVPLGDLGRAGDFPASSSSSSPSPPSAAELHHGVPASDSEKIAGPNAVRVHVRRQTDARGVLVHGELVASRRVFQSGKCVSFRASSARFAARASRSSRPGSARKNPEARRSGSSPRVRGRRACRNRTRTRSARRGAWPNVATVRHRSSSSSSRRRRSRLAFF